MSAKPGDGIADCALMWYVWGRILIIGCHERMRMQKFGESTVMELEILRPLAQSGKKSAPYLNVLEKKPRCRPQATTYLSIQSSLALVEIRD